MKKFNNKQLIFNTLEALSPKILPPDLKTSVYFFICSPSSIYCFRGLCTVMESRNQ